MAWATLATAALGMAHCASNAQADRHAPHLQRMAQPTSEPSAAPPAKAHKANKAQRKAPPPKATARSTSALAETAYLHRSDAMQWADAAAASLGLPPDWLRHHVGRAMRVRSIETLVLPAPNPSAKNWAAYRARFIEPKRIAAGADFWQRHRSTLARAEATYGVPVSIIVGIIGVETLYGQHMGNYRTLDALATLAFDFPAAHPRASDRQAFFTAELGHFLHMAHAAGRDPGDYRSSYAGAMGLPQFMPSSWQKFAVDFDGDGRIDLYGSPADAIGSVGHYLQRFSWTPGMATHYPVSVVADDLALADLLAPDIVPSFSPEAFERKGAQLGVAAQSHTGRLALIELRNGSQSPSYVAGTDNFYALTRYNWSSYYAMAVIELGQAVAERVQTVASSSDKIAP